MNQFSCLEWWCHKSKDFRLFVSGIIISILFYFLLEISVGVLDIFVLLFAGVFPGVIIGIWLIVCSAFWDFANDKSKESWKNLIGILLLVIITGLIGLAVFFSVLYLFVKLPCRKYNELTTVKETTGEDS